MVDDNPGVRRLTREVLEGEGYQVIEASDGGEALKKIEGMVPDLVILDLEMPGLDGSAVLRQLRADPRFSGMRVVAFTASPMESEPEKAIAAGFDAFLPKQTTPSILRRKVRELLD